MGTVGDAVLDGWTLADDRVESERFRRPERQFQFLAGRALLRRLLSRATGTPSWRIKRDGEGRPVALDAAGRPGPDVSISHAGRWVACAVARGGRIGVDVEVPNPRRDALALARACLSPAEGEAVAREGEPALLRAWTVREALAKAMGGGVMRALELRLPPDLPPHSAAVVLDGRRWAVAELAGAQFHLALAWEPPGWAGDPAGAASGALGAAWASIHRPT